MEDPAPEAFGASLFALPVLAGQHATTQQRPGHDTEPQRVGRLEQVGLGLTMDQATRASDKALSRHEVIQVVEGHFLYLPSEFNMTTIINYNHHICQPRSADIGKRFRQSRVARVDSSTNEYHALAPLAATLGALIGDYDDVHYPAEAVSLRGAHLIGMFVRTAKGQAFRAWTLDQRDEIDRQADPGRSLMAAWSNRPPHAMSSPANCRRRCSSVLWWRRVGA